jgi:subtilisin family serine protease
LVAACSDSPPISAPTEQAPAPLLAAGQKQIPDRYIVVFKSNVSDPKGKTDEVVRGSGAKVHFKYDKALRGFAATIPAGALDRIRKDPNVAYVEADAEVSVFGDQASPASWGIDRVDERDLPLDNNYHYDNTASNVHAYIVDTGIFPSHAEYNGRVTSGFDFIDNDNNTADCHGHGTHVAGTVGGTTTGIAKQVQLVGVRVLNCQGSGSNSQVIAGINWVAANAIKPAVANMSLGGGFSQALNDAVTNAVASGVPFAIAAGNSNANACSYSPASAPNAITVGATTNTDARSSFSNYGTCLDIFAPGSAIVSSVQTGGYESWNGTSMATPHVAGAVALLLSANPTWTPAQVASALTGNATVNKVTNAGTGSPNRLLYTGSGAAPPPATVVHSGDLDGSVTSPGGNSWDAVVNVLAHNAAHAAVVGATVTGTWSTGGSGSCVTAASGRCSITKSVKRNSASTTFTVTGISGAGLSYNGASNHDPDAGNGTVITITK